MSLFLLFLLPPPLDTRSPKQSLECPLTGLSGLNSPEAPLSNRCGTNRIGLDEEPGSVAFSVCVCVCVCRGHCMQVTALRTHADGTRRNAPAVRRFLTFCLFLRCLQTPLNPRIHFVFASLLRRRPWIRLLGYLFSAPHKSFFLFLVA